MCCDAYSVLKTTLSYPSVVVHVPSNVTHSELPPSIRTPHCYISVTLVHCTPPPIPPKNASEGEFKGVVDCAKKLVKAEGVVSLWKGYTPAVIKLAPHTVISFMILDNMTRLLLGKDAL